jgi:putative toxin-antitoxin system antitoxin component (TIGR02293 family)
MAKHIKTKTQSKTDGNAMERGEILARVVFTGGIEVRDSVSRTTIDDNESPVYYVAEDATQKIYPKILDDDRNFHQLIKATRNGLPYKSLKTAQGIMPFSNQEWAQMLHISTRSIDRLKNENKKLSTTQSDKLIEVTLLYDYGVDVFGSSEKFSQWLNRTNIALGGVTPKSLLDTNQGINAVKSALSRIEYGVLS